MKDSQNITYIFVPLQVVLHLVEIIILASNLIGSDPGGSGLA